MNKDAQIENLRKRIKELEYENHILKVTFATCSHCKNADLYKPIYTYPYFDPRCKKTGNKITHLKKACKDLKICGRGGE